MILEATCKFCHKKLHLEIDDAYGPHDPLKLIPLACCNRCGDFQEARRMVHGKVKKVCMNILGRKLSDEERKKVGEHLTKLVQRYMRLISDRRDCPMPDWDAGIVEDMLAKPGNFSLILGQVPKMFAQPTLV